MLKIKRLFLIFTFLCVHFSSSAQTVVNPMLEASLCERDAFYAGNPVEYNDALLRKAEIQMQQGLYADALHSMERLRMYSIPAAKRKEIGFKNIEKFDIYPPEANRWNNTHFYAIIAEK